MGLTLEGAGVGRHQADQPAWVISLGRPEAMRLTAYGVVMLFLGVGVFSAFAEVDTSMARSLSLLGAFVVTMVAHELIHGLFFRLFGGSPRFGAGLSFILPYLSTTSDGDRFDAKEMSIIGLAPLLSLSVGSLIAGSVWPPLAPYALVVFLANVSGSVGDIWLVATVWRFAGLRDVTFEDRETGVAVWTEDEEVEQVLEVIRGGTNTAVSGFVARFAMASVAILLITIVIGVFAAFSLPDDQAFRIGPAVLPLFEKESTGGGVLLSIDVRPPLVGGLLFAALASAFRLGQRRPGTRPGDHQDGEAWGPSQSR